VARADDIDRHWGMGCMDVLLIVAAVPPARGAAPNTPTGLILRPYLQFQGADRIRSKWQARALRLRFPTYWTPMSAPSARTSKRSDGSGAAGFAAVTSGGEM